MSSFMFGAGRLGRVHYFFVNAALTLAGVVLVLVTTTTTDPATGQAVLSGDRFIGALALTWLGGANATRRAHDRDHTGWFVVLLFVPLVNIVTALYLLFAPSDPATNRHGPPAERPERLSAGEYDIAVAILRAEEEVDERTRNEALLNDDGTFDFDGLMRRD